MSETYLYFFNLHVSYHTPDVRDKMKTMRRKDHIREYWSIFCGSCKAKSFSRYYYDNDIIKKRERERERKKEKEIPKDQKSKSQLESSSWEWIFQKKCVNVLSVYPSKAILSTKMKMLKM